MNRIFGRIKLVRASKSLFFFLLFSPLLGVSQAKVLRLSIKDYQDRVQAVWVSQMLGAMMGWPFEHKVASVSWSIRFPKSIRMLLLMMIGIMKWWQFVHLRNTEST